MNIMQFFYQRRIKKSVVVLAVLLLLAGLGFGYLRYQFPHGRSHNCSKSIAFILMEYAEDHGGRFPSAGGQGASLALLVDQNYISAVGMLAGKSISSSVTEEYYAKHGTLSDEVCGWHYIEGLKNTDPSGLAILWSKVPLGHNGQRLRIPAYEVIYIDGSVRYIVESDWPKFLAKQKQLRPLR